MPGLLRRTTEHARLSNLLRNARNAAGPERSSDRNGFAHRSCVELQDCDAFDLSPQELFLSGSSQGISGEPVWRHESAGIWRIFGDPKGGWIDEEDRYSPRASRRRHRKVDALD